MVHICNWDRRRGGLKESQDRTEGKLSSKEENRGRVFKR